MKFISKTLLVSTALLTFGTAAAAPENFTVDYNHTFPMFEVTHFGISTQRGRFDKTQGKIVLDRAAKTGSIDLTIDSASINMGFDAWNKHLRAEDFFNVEKFPTMTFKSKKLIFQGNKLVGADGEFTLRGVTKPLRLKVANFTCTEHPLLKKPYCGAEVTATIKRSDFGMGYGVPMVSDQVRLISPVEAIKDWNGEMPKQ